MSVKCLLLLQYVCLAACLHIKDLEDSGDITHCEKYKRSQIVVLEDTTRRSLRINVTVPPPQIQIRQAFRGERVALRCFHTQRGSKYAWYLSATAPVGSSVLASALVPLPSNSCFQRRFYSYKAFGVEVVEVVAQTGTVGYFTCAENVGESQWIQRGVFLILLYQQSTVVLQVDLAATSYVSCEAASIPLSFAKISFGRYGVPQTITAADPQCVQESKTWSCIKFIGQWDEYEWKRKRLERTTSGFIHTGPLDRTVRLRFEQIQVGFRLDFVHFSSENDYHPKTLNSFEMTQESLCVEARQVGRRFNWMVLEVYLGYAELTGGFRIPFKGTFSPGDLDILDGLQVHQSGGGSFRTVFLEEALDPQAVLDRAPLVPYEDASSLPPLRYWRSHPCGPPLTAIGHGFVSTVHNQLCTQKATTFTTVLIGDVAKVPRGSGLSIIVKVPPQGACIDCFVSLYVDRRGAASIPLKWPMSRKFAPPLRPINNRVAPIRPMVGNRLHFTAFRTFTLSWNESDLTDSREDLRDWFERMEFKTASENVSIIYKNSWPVCAEGQHLAIANPPFCVPCPPGTKATVYKAIGSYQPEPGQTKCIDCSTSYNPYFCAEAPPTPITLGGSAEDTIPPPETGQSTMQLRRTSTISTAGVLFICLCMIGLLVCIVYFYLEAIGFMLVMIARAPYTKRTVQKKRPQICELEILQLQQLYPDIDLHELARQELCRAEILGLRLLHPEINWDEIVCEAEVRRLHDNYPFIRWEKILRTELPYVLRAKYPFINWNQIAAEDACGREIDRLRAENPEMDWTTVLCEARIESLQRKFPCLNWSGIVCEERIRRLRSAYPDVDFDQLVRDELCEAEMEQLKRQHPEIDWQAIVCAERALWLKARHPMVRWENIVSEEKVVRLRNLYPCIDWPNVIRNNLCEKEIESLKKRFPRLEWESIVRGGDASMKRLSKTVAIERLNMRFSDVTWENVITEDLSDCAIKRWRREYPYFDWNAITTAIFQPITLKSVNFKNPEVCKSFREHVTYLEELYPCVDWRYFVEKKYASPYINWDYIINCEEGESMQEGEKLDSTIIDRLNLRYRFVNWSAFQNIGVEKMRREHPYIHWTVVLEENDLCEDETFGQGNIEPVTLPEVSPVVLKMEKRVKGPKVTAEQEILRLRLEYPHINWEKVIAKERRRKRTEHDLQSGDWEHPRIEIPAETKPSDKIHGSVEIKSETINPSTEVTEINRMRNLYPNINWTSVVEHELRKRQRDGEKK
ncbi:DNA methylase N 6 adenine specific [Echinococcus multilocularis]|uniref:DNA methylase N 6 adenine specific n=1 Tax=Echinococcus multilocularis TaxID=6211 RepID=A0A087VXS1_ECHMU|nr:DNA methylase N 6 adenine specific [Echinococcus multilocularis]